MTPSSSHSPVTKMTTPQRSASQDSTADGIRKRVCKACDRCRLKKSKCDGSHPCSRCKADNAICVFGERKKSHDKVYPKGYVEMLEQQQSQLVAGLREMYTRLQAAGAWAGDDLAEQKDGHPLTHDMLAALNLLEIKHDGSGELETFEDDFGKLQSKLISQGAGYIHRRGSLSSESEHSQGHARSASHNTPVLSKPVLFKKDSLDDSAPTSPPPEYSPAPGSRQRQSFLANQPSPLQQESPMSFDPQIYTPSWAFPHVSNPEVMFRSSFALQAPVLDQGMGSMSDANAFGQQFEMAPDSFDDQYGIPPATSYSIYGNMPNMSDPSVEPMDVEFNKFLSIMT